jgi:hypothetical protein
MDDEDMARNIEEDLEKMNEKHNLSIEWDLKYTQETRHISAGRPNVQDRRI